MANSRPKRPKAPPPRLNLEEMEHDPSMRGMLSFLEIAPAEKLEMLRRRSEVDAATALPSPAPETPVPVKPGAITSGAPKVPAPIVSPSIVVPPDSGAVSSDAPELTEPRPSASGAATEPSPPAAVLDAPNGGARTIGAPTLDAPRVAAPKDLEKHAAPRENTAGTPGLGAPELGEVYVYRPNRPLQRLASTAQDGHTHGEQVLLATLWRLARPAGQAPFRAISIGERTLAGEVPMAYSTVQENLRSLAAKLAIEIRSNGPHQPKTYIVYPDSEILRRRHAAGLTHVIRRTSAVMLVNPAISSAPSTGAPSGSSAPSA